VETRESVNELVDHTVASIAGGRLECASDIVMLRASELAHAIKCRDVSCCEVMQAYLKDISAFWSLSAAGWNGFVRSILSSAFGEPGVCCEDYRHRYSHWTQGSDRNARSRKLSGWNGECGCSRSTDDIFDAVVAHRAWCNALKKLFGSYEFAILPAAQVFPFDVALEWPQRIAGRAIESCEDCWRVTIPVIMTGCPTVTVPVGFDGDGLPMGMQIIARHGADITCLELASAYEAASCWIEARLPSLLRARVSKEEAPKA
jgi:Asp-tRNA(Asn)/Glu-tRNA(Gln) amidotransferase A subunit family amidase